MVGNLVAEAVGQLDRLARSRAWQQHWLADSIDEYELDAVLWHGTQTAAAAAATMDAVNDAAGHPEPSEDALAGQDDIAAATRALRADLTWLTTLADAAARIDAALARRRRTPAPRTPTRPGQRATDSPTGDVGHRARRAPVQPRHPRSGDRDRRLRHPGVGSAGDTIGAAPGEGCAWRVRQLSGGQYEVAASAFPAVAIVSASGIVRLILASGGYIVRTASPASGVVDVSCGCQLRQRRRSARHPPR
jgi:hypothetical protein